MRELYTRRSTINPLIFRIRLCENSKRVESPKWKRKTTMTQDSLCVPPSSKVSQGLLPVDLIRFWLTNSASSYYPETFMTPGQLISARTNKKAFVSLKPAPYVPSGVMVLSTGLSNRATMFCRQRSLRSFCDGIAESLFFD